MTYSLARDKRHWSAMRIYLSSTLNDLKDERDAVKEALAGLGHYTVVESYDADEMSVRQSCLADVASCELYVGIVGLRYGFIPPGQTKSITELEFDAASEIGLRRLVFLKAPVATQASMSDAYSKERDPALIEDFRNRLSSGTQDVPRPTLFSDCDELAKRLLRALLRLQSPSSSASSPDIRPAQPTDGGQPFADELSDLPSDVGRGASELQRMLWVHLCTHWQQISVAPLFHKAEVIQRCPKPLTIRTVFNAVIESDCEDVLDGLRSCFDPSKSNQSQALLDRSSPAYEALTLIALVAAEQFVLAQRKALDDVCCAPHEPIPGQDPLLSAVVAAAIFRFGLRFRPENRLPVNVVHAKPPQAELGNPGEEGPSLFRKELLAMANRVELGSEHDLTDIEDVSNRRLGRLVARVAQRLDCPVALSAEASGALSGSEARRSLLDDMGQIGVRAFFTPIVHDNQPASIRNLLSDLKVLLTPFFFPTSAPTATEDQTMSKTGSPPPTTAGVINNFFGPVGDIAQANAQGASAAGRDVVQGSVERNLIELLTALTRAVESHPGNAAAHEKEALLSYIGDIQGVMTKPKEQRTESEAKLVKRCLDGLKQGAEAVENGSTILEKLSPLWQGLKASWPALAALLS